MTPDARSWSPTPTTRRPVVFRDIASELDEELAPKRIYRTELKIT